MYHLLCRYLESCAAISITKDFKAHFRGTQTQWSQLDDDFVDLLYQCFLVVIYNMFMCSLKFLKLDLKAQNKNLYYVVVLS